MPDFRPVAAMLPLCIGLHLRAQFLTTTLPNIIPPRYGYGDQAMMDLEGDGDIDGLALESGHGIMVHLNEGLHAYRFPILIYDDPDTQLAAYADLDGDGLVDVVSTIDIGDDRRLVVLLQTAPYTFQTLAVDSVTNDPAMDLLYLFDTDGDGDLDILWEAMGTGRVYRNSGNGTFLSALPIAGNFIDLAMMGDVDGNGTEDIVGSYSANEAIEWYSGQGDGTFEPLQTLITNTDHFTDLGLGDIDGDQDLDIALCLGGWSGLGAITPYLNDGMGGYTVSSNIVSGLTDLGERMLLTDLDSDDDLDIVGAEQNDWFWLSNNGSGSFTAPQALDGIDNIGGVPISSVDADQDGTMDLLFPGLDLEFNNGAEHMEEELNLYVDQPGPRMFVADMDGDGDQDLTTTHRDWVGIEQGLPAYMVGVTDSLHGGELDPMPHVCDADGDGDNDQVVIDGDGDVAILRNDGGGHFGVATAISLGNGEALEVGDLDQDGDPDLVVGTSAGYSWYSNNGSGSFTLENPVTSGLVYDVTILDATGDGILDICVSHANQIGLEPGLGGGLFSSQVIPSLTAYRAFASADVDGDGAYDLIGAGDGSIDLYRADGVGGYYPGETIFGDVSIPGQVDLIDLDNDNLPDLLFASVNYDPGGQPLMVGWSHNDGVSPFGSYDTLAFASICNGCGGSAGYGMLDIDTDGDIDVVSLVGEQEPWLRLHRNQTGGSCSISGSVFVDLDQDQTQEPGEPGFPFAVVSTDEPSSFVVLDPSGSYSISVDTGTYLVQCAIPTPWWQLTTSPATYTAPLITAGSQVSGLNFGYYPAIDTLSVLSSFVSSPTRCGFQIHQWVTYRNEGTIGPLLGYVRLAKDPLVGFLGSVPPPDSIVGDTIYYGYEDLALFEERTIRLDVQMPSVAYQGDTIRAELTVVAFDDGGENTQITTTPWQSVISCAYDPNDKQVEPVGFGAYGAIDIATDAVTYTIRFQNTGLDTAFTVVLMDQLDPLLDRSSLSVLSSSHVLTAVEVDANGLLTFRFEDIHLPSVSIDSLGSQGFVRFRVGIASDPSNYSILQNTARIYFDFNPPIITNTVSNTLVDCSTYAPTITQLQGGTLMAPAGLSYQWYLNGLPLSDTDTALYQPSAEGNYAVEVLSAYGCVGSSTTILVGIGQLATKRLVSYPNPTSHELTVEFPRMLSTEAHLVLLDQLGRQVLAANCSGITHVTLNVADIRSGVYVVRVVEKGTTVGYARVVVG